MNYLNTKPLLYGIKNHKVIGQIEIIEDYPARVADMLLNDEIDVGLVPVATLLRMDEWHIVGNYGIGCDGEVASVCIFSEVPIEEIEEVYLDYQSRTSARLARILLRDYWKVSPEIINATGEDFREKIEGKKAALVIGDRALEQRATSSYIYDLGEAWKLHTGLPFVFAAWISRRKLPPSFVEMFDEANRQGADHSPVFANSLAGYSYDLATYFRDNIRFELDERAREGLKCFLEKKLE